MRCRRRPSFTQCSSKWLRQVRATGNIDAMLEKMADFWDAEIETDAQRPDFAARTIFDYNFGLYRWRHRDFDVSADLQAQRYCFGALEELGNFFQEKPGVEQLNPIATEGGTFMFSRIATRIYVTDIKAAEDEDSVILHRVLPDLKQTELWLSAKYSLNAYCFVESPGGCPNPIALARGHTS